MTKINRTADANTFTAAMASSLLHITVGRAQTLVREKKLVLSIEGVREYAGRKVERVSNKDEKWYSVKLTPAQAALWKADGYDVKSASEVTRERDAKSLAEAATKVATLGLQL